MPGLLTLVRSLTVIYNPYQRDYPPQYAIPMAGGGRGATAMRESAKAATALAAGALAKAARGAFPKKKAKAARAAAHARSRGTRKAQAHDARARASQSVAYKRGSYKKKGASKWEKRFPQVIKQKYWLTEYTNYKNIAAPGHLTGQMQGTVLNPTGLYSIDSGSAESASVVVLALNNTEAHWVSSCKLNIPTIVNTRYYRTPRLSTRVKLDPIVPVSSYADRRQGQWLQPPLELPQPTTHSYGNRMQEIRTYSLGHVRCSRTGVVRLLWTIRSPQDPSPTP